jgi:hypothetical protein
VIAKVMLGLELTSSGPIKPEAAHGCNPPYRENLPQLLILHDDGLNFGRKKERLVYPEAPLLIPTYILRLQSFTSERHRLGMERPHPPLFILAAAEAVANVREACGYLTRLNLVLTGRGDTDSDRVTPVSQLNTVAPCPTHPHPISLDNGQPNKPKLPPR